MKPIFSQLCALKKYSDEEKKTKFWILSCHIGNRGEIVVRK